MSRRRKSATSPKTTENATESDEWSEEEKKRLLDALKRDDGENNWRWITRQVNTKTMNQVKEFAAKLKTKKHIGNARSPSSANKRPIAPKESGPLEGWISATKRLRGHDDVDATCIPQRQITREEACQEADSGIKNAASSMYNHNDEKNEEEQQQVPELTSISDHHTPSSSDSIDEEQIQRNHSIILVDLLTGQKEMMQKISLLESMLEKLRSDGASSQSSLKDMLINITNKLECLTTNTPHGCCGGPVIIQTTPHANLVHQPILSPCSSCSDGKQDKRHQSSLSVSDKENVTVNNSNDTVSTVSVRRTSVQTSSNPKSITSKASNNECHSICTSSLVVDSHEKSLSASQRILQTRISSPEITPCLASTPVSTEPSVSVSNNYESQSIKFNVSCESAIKEASSVPAKEHRPDGCVEKTSRQETCLPVIVDSHTLSNGTSSVASVINRSPTVVTTASATCNLVQREVSTATSQQRGLISERLVVTVPQQTCATPCRDTVASVQTTVSQLSSSYIDLQNTLPASPVFTTVSRSSTARFLPFSNPLETSHRPQQRPLGPHPSIAAMPLQRSQNGQIPRVPVQSITPTSDQTSIPPGFITLSHTTDVTPSPSKIPSTQLSQPQTIRTTSRSPSGEAKELHLSSAAGAVIRKAANEACGKQKLAAASPKELLNAAMLISNFITDQPNFEHQAQWQSCLSEIVTDYHKNLDPSRGDFSQLVSIGYNPYVVLTQYELEDMLEKSKGRPKYFALRLAEKLFGIDILIKSTPYGIGGKAALHPVILDAIKVEVLRRFASDVSNDGQIALWKSCVTSIAQRCKRARNPRKNRSLKRVSANSDDLGPPSMAVGGGIQLSEHDENEDSPGELDDEDEDSEMGLDQPAVRQTPPSPIRIPSDDEKTATGNGTQEGDHSDAGCITQAKDSAAGPKSVVDSSVEKHDETEDVAEESIPPGIDPDITVVHLPSNFQAPVKQTVQRQNPVAVKAKHVTTSSENNVSVTGEESRRVEAQQCVDGREREREHESKEKGSPVADDFPGNYLQMVQNFPNPDASIESVIVSGIRMTPDYSHALVGGNPNIVISRQKYLDALTKSSQPTHFAVRLAELVFGDDVLEASTVTGGKRGTMQLDPVVIKAIQIDVTDRFLKNLDPEQQNVVWRKCVTSIATRCKTLRYNRSKTTENQWTLIQPSQITKEKPAGC